MENQTPTGIGDGHQTGNSLPLSTKLIPINECTSLPSLSPHYFMLVGPPSLLLKINPQARWVLPSPNYFTLFTSSSQMGILTNSFYNTGFELKSIWEFGFSCFTPRYRRRRPISAEDEEEEEQDCNNKAWLLAEPDLSGSDEPNSVHSSFRFSLCSQIELESFAVNRGPSSAAVLMVNLENGFLTDSHSAEVKKFRRFESLERNISPVANSLIRFTYSEIVSATRNFSAGRVLGRGALSCVFKGRVGFRKMAVAIKRLHKEDKESSKAFCRELMIASSLHNPHIVPLLGFCIDADQGLFLVYKNVSGGSLDRILLHERKRRVKGGGAPLPWSARYKIALGIAEAIEYLHNGTGRCVVHRDIKPGNILLSSKKRAKLCDFGLALWTPAPSIPFLCKTVKGTIGYLAPEYFQHGKVSDKTDVYAFGVVLLELLTGRKPIESKRGSGEENLVLWAKQQLRQGCAEKLRDPQLEVGKKDSIRVRRMVRAAAACINNEESLRPDMTEILIVLRGEPACGAVSRKRATLLRSCSSVTDCYPHFQQTNSMVKNHFAVAMMGVDSEDDDPLDFQ